MKSIKKLPELERQMVKITVECTEKDLTAVDKNVIKQALEKVFYYKPIKYKVPKIQTGRIQELTEQLSSVEALEKVLEHKEELSEDQRKQILIRGKGILKDA